MSVFNGVHPPDRKSATSHMAVEILEIKEGDDFFLSLVQHIGAPAKPVVQKGQQVRKGELIAEAAGFISANIHSPVEGVVTGIDRVDYPVTGIAPCIVIKASLQESEPVLLEENYPSLGELAKAAGIVGMGGAMFPSHVKLSPGEPLDTLIVNGVECEPYLTCDHRLMLERSEDLIEGTQIIKEALGLDKVIIGIEANKKDAAEKLESLSQGRVEIKLLPMLYPQGGEKQLIKSVTGREVPEGKLPAALGIIVHNVSTVLAVYDARMKRLPLISRVVTVSGKVNTPKNILTPLGTPLSRLVEFCGGLQEGTGVNKEYKFVLGGPMTGFSAHSTNIPVYKGMNGVLFLEEERHPEPEPCIRCGRCVRACPASLSPLTLEKFASLNMYEELYKWKLLSCIECSACNYVCPSYRPLKTLFRLTKGPTAAVAAERANGK